MSAIDVLTSTEMLCCICDYQNGAYHQRHPLRSLPTPRIRRGTIFERWAKEDLMKIDAVLARWYVTHSLSRMSSLLHTIQRRIVAIHAVYYGKIHILEALLKHATFDSISENLLDWAAFNGQIKMIQFIDSLCTDSKQPRLFWRVCTVLAMDLAASEGHLEIVQWLQTSIHRRQGCSSHAFDGAARNGNLQVLKWLHAHGKHGTVRAMDDAASNGHLSIVQWLTLQNSPATEGSMNGAAARGDLEIVKFLHEHRKEGCTVEAMDAAARNGHLKCVQWLHAHRTEGCTIEAVDGAARHGYLHVVRWLLENRHEGFTKLAIRRASQNGHSNVADFLKHQRACIIQ